MILSLGIGSFPFFRKFHISTFCIIPEQMFKNLIKIMFANNFTAILCNLLSKPYLKLFQVLFTRQKHKCLGYPRHYDLSFPMYSHRRRLP